MADDGLTEGERMIRRAQGVAMGLADAGLSQAEEMLRRVSPEGRAQAKRERQARARRRNRVIGQVVMVGLAALLVLILLTAIGLNPVASAAAVALATLVVAAFLAQRARVHAPRAEALPLADLSALPVQASAWLGSQRKALPAPAMRLADSLSTRLDELQPQLARLSPQEPAAEAVRKLIATELPGLVDGWKAVPPSLRQQPGATGRTPDAQLADGLKLIDGEVARMTEQLARGALDEVATQGRYLELKYRSDGSLG